MSKSAGNIIDPFVLVEKYGADALRYYLMSDIATGKDADFSEKRLVSRHDTDLANSLGNLLNRMLNMTSRFRQGRDFYFGWELEEDQEWRKVVTEASQFAQEFHVTQVRKDEELHGLLTRFLKYEQLPSDFSWDLLWVLEHMAVISNCVMGYQNEMEQCAISDAVEIAMHATTSCNTLIDRISPWKIVKKPASERILASVLYALAESLRIIAILVSPVLPQAAHGIFDQLNWKMELSGKEERFSLADAEWGRLPDGHVVGKPVPLFPRIETT
jgi:methionyl-tRNA synthetase